MDESLFSIDEFIENGMTLFNMGMYKELIEVCREFLQETKDDRIYSMLASAEFSIGDAQSAEKSVRLGLSINPKNPDLLYNLACILQHKGALSNAMRYFARAEKASTHKVKNGLSDDTELADICRSEITRLKETLGKSEDEIIPNKAKKHVLVVAFIYPPLSGSGVQRTVKLVKYLRSFDWEPIVITAAGEAAFLGDEYFDELPDDIEVYRIPREKEITKSDLEYMKSKISHMLSEPMRRRLQIYYDKLNIDMQYTLMAFPEEVVLWANRIADDLCKYIDINKIDAVYSTSGPFSDHIAGYFIKEQYGIPWVADFRDEWSNNPILWPDKENIHYKMCIDCEQTILDKADHVICVTETSRDNFINLGIHPEKISCITNGYDEEDFEWLKHSDFGRKTDNEKFTIIHNGLLYSDRSVPTILEAIRNLINRNEIDANKVMFHIGNIFNETDREESNKLIDKYAMEDIAFHTAYMEHFDSLVHAASADLLMIILGTSKEYASVYTGKIFEYLRLGTQILSLAPCGGILAKLLKKTGHGVTVEYSDVAGIEKEILHFYRIWTKNKKNGITGPLLPNTTVDITMYERKNLTRRFAEIVNEVSKYS